MDGRRRHPWETCTEVVKESVNPTRIAKARKDGRKVAEKSGAYGPGRKK